MTHHDRDTPTQGHGWTMDSGCSYIPERSHFVSSGLNVVGTRASVATDPAQYPYAGPQPVQDVGAP